ncbi:MAG: nucleotide-diphospho-sugar transferase [Bacteroidetes bacterium]|nr:nucleotide-diphospho-sugar transferase [Bacteroidota bacterium]
MEITVTEQFQTPILFLIYNRPDTTLRVFEQLKKIKPRHLYIAADGPRPHKTGEADLCQQTRLLVLNNIDWECDLHTRFLVSNVGCKMAVSSALTWFFDHVNEGIILEDDCLPHISFFYFCQALLEYYRNDTRVMHIGGSNFQDGIIRSDGSYYFSRLGHIWGWGTWKRAWKFYDVALSQYPFARTDKHFHSVFPTKRIERYWMRNFELVYSNKRDTWDYQWQFALFLNRGLAITPNVNLVSNIGFSENATHTTDHFHDMANRPTYPITEILHPTQMIINIEADIYTMNRYLNPPKWKKVIYLFKQMYYTYIHQD